MYAYQKRLCCIFIIFNFAVLQNIIHISCVHNPFGVGDNLYEDGEDIDDPRYNYQNEIIHDPNSVGGRAYTLLRDEYQRTHGRMGRSVNSRGSEMERSINVMVVIGVMAVAAILMGAAIVSRAFRNRRPFDYSEIDSVKVIEDLTTEAPTDGTSKKVKATSLRK